MNRSPLAARPTQAENGLPGATDAFSLVGCDGRSPHPDHLQSFQKRSLTDSAPFASTLRAGIHPRREKKGNETNPKVRPGAIKNAVSTQERTQYEPTPGPVLHQTNPTDEDGKRTGAGLRKRLHAESDRERGWSSAALQDRPEDRAALTEGRLSGIVNVHPAELGFVERALDGGDA